MQWKLSYWGKLSVATRNTNHSGKCLLILQLQRRPRKHGSSQTVQVSPDLADETSPTRKYSFYTACKPSVEFVNRTGLAKRDWIEPNACDVFRRHLQQPKWLIAQATTKPSSWDNGIVWLSPENRRSLTESALFLAVTGRRSWKAVIHALSAGLTCTGG